MLHSRVIVGTPATPTPELLTPLSAVRFNPSWTPTTAMVRREGARPVAPGPHNMIASGATRSVPLSAPIPVLLTYQTRFADEGGEMKTYPDVYGRRQIAGLHGVTEQQALLTGCRSSF